TAAVRSRSPRRPPSAESPPDYHRAPRDTPSTVGPAAVDARAAPAVQSPPQAVVPRTSPSGGTRPMTESGSFPIHTHGAARGNPGPAASANTIEHDGDTDVEAKGRLGETTNNVAEYTAVVRALEHAKQLGASRVEVLSDSELMVNQMMGRYKVKNEGLRPLYEEARALCSAFKSVTFRHVRREENSRADRLCNQALDGAEGKAAPAGGRARPAAAKLAPERADAVREEA